MLKRNLAIVLFLFLSSLPAGNSDGILVEAEKLIDQKSYANAVQMLQTNLPDPKSDPRSWARFQVMLARCRNATGNPKAALETLDRVTVHRPSDWHLERAHALFASGNCRDALEMTDHCEKDASLNLVHRVLPLLWIRAQSQMRLELYRPCMQTCSKIINMSVKNAPEGFSDYKLSPATMQEMQDIKAAATKLYYNAREAYDIKTYGKNFALYRKGREAEFAGRYKDAREFYAQINDGTLKEAAACYTGACLIAEGRNDEALKHYTQLIKSDFTGLYRGEMMYNTILLLYLNGKTGQALEWSGKLREWCKLVSMPDKTPAPQLSQINEALKRDIIDQAPKTFLRLDDCGNLIATAKYPETINNRLTSPWYLPNLTVRAELLYGFLLGEKGNAAEAAIVYEKAPTLTPMQIIRDPYTVRNLKAGLANDVYLFSKQVDKSIRDFKDPLRLAFFFYVSDNKREAEKIFDYVIIQAAKKHSYPDLAAANLGKMYCLIERKQTQQALQLAAAAIQNKEFEKTIALGEMRFLKACILAQNKATFNQAENEFRLLAGITASAAESAAGSAADRKKKKKDSRSQANAAVKGKVKSYIAPKALFTLALAAVNHGKPEVAKYACKELQSKYDDSPLVKASETLMTALSNPSKKLPHPLALVETRTGKVFLHRRIVVFPGAAQWINLENEVNAGDIIVYQIKFIPRNNCTIVRNTWVELDAGEPSPPQADGSEICFVRAPALFQPFLLNNMDSLKHRR